MELNNETEEIDKILRDIHKYLAQYTKVNLKKNNLTMPRFMVLWYISKCQSVNMSSLHEKMYMANSTLTVIVDKLVETEFVERYRSPKDRRVVLLELTESGDKKLCKILNLRQSFLQEAMDDLNLADQTKLIELLSPILNNFKNMLEEGEKLDE